MGTDPSRGNAIHMPPLARAPRHRWLALVSVSSLLIPATYNLWYRVDGRSARVVTSLVRPGGPRDGALFGHSICSLDWNGDAVPDVAVSAPGESRCYIFMGPELSAVEQLFVGDGSFELEGKTLQLVPGDFDGDGDDELVVSDPGARMNSLLDHGGVWVFGLRGEGPERLAAPPGATGLRLGTSLAVGDWNNDGLDDLAVGGPGRTGGPTTGCVGVYIRLSEGAWSQPHWLQNPQETGFANFGHQLAVCRWDSDSIDDLVVGAIWNTHSTGIVGRGQAFVYCHPYSSVYGGPTAVLEDDAPEPTEVDPEVRWGMSIAADQDRVLVGAPRKQAGGVTDAGVGFLFNRAGRLRHLEGLPVENGILGYRTAFAEFDGIPPKEAVLASLKYGVLYWDRIQSSRMPVVITGRPWGGSSHWCRGFCVADLDGDGRSELALGDDLFPVTRSREGERKDGAQGRVLILNPAN